MTGALIGAWSLVIIAAVAIWPHARRRGVPPVSRRTLRRLEDDRP